MKVFLNYLTKFLLTISFFAITIISVIRFSLLSPNYIKNKIIKTDYYNKMNNLIKVEMSNYLEQSGLDDSAINNVFTKEEIKTDTINLIESFYKNEKYFVSTDVIANKIRNNIDDFIDKNKINNRNESEITALITKLTDVYKSHVGYNNILNQYKDKINNAKINMNYITIVLIVLIAVLYIYQRYIYKERNIILVFISNFLYLILLYLYIQNKVDINHLLILNDVFSNLLTNYLNGIITIIKNIAIIYLIIGVIFSSLSVGLIKELKRYNKIISIILVVLWMGVIFSFSSENGTNSTSTSNKVTEVIVNVTSLVTGNKVDDETLNKIMIDKKIIVRKAGHFIEYLILFGLLLNVLKQYNKINQRYLKLILIICVLYAFSDEFHQMFVSQRSAKIFDVIIDSMGSVTGLLIYKAKNIVLNNMSNKN